jgi:hypothetical protein
MDIERGEKKEQVRFIKWTHRPDVRQFAPALLWIFHCPDDGKRDAMTGGQMRALCVKPGVSALTSLWRDGGSGLAIEMENTTDTMTVSQDEWLTQLKAHGWSTTRCSNAEEAREAVMRYLGTNLPPL